MKKLSLYISIALAGLFMGSCSEDFKDWADPQTNPQEDAITIPGYQASAVSALDLANVAEARMFIPSALPLFQKVSNWETAESN